MNLQHLRFVKAVAETASFSKAAGICCVTQPTLSNAIAQFEDQIGGKVFVRTTRKVSVTRFGEHILGYVRAVLEAQDELTSAAKAFIEPPHKLLRIGFSPLIDMGLLNLALDAYRHSHAEVELFFKECYINDLEGRLENEAIDAVILPSGKQPSHREACAFYSEPLCVVRNDEHGRRGEDAAVRLKDVVDDTMILTGGGCGLNDVVGELFKREGLEMTVYPGHALSYQVLQDWALLGIGAAIVPQSKLCKAARAKAATLETQRGEPMRVAFDLVWNAETTKPQHLEDLIAHFQDVVPDIVAGRAPR